MFDIIIVGAGPAGLTAAIYAKRAGCNVIIIEKMFAGGQMTQTLEIENYPGFINITGPDLSAIMEKQVRELGVEIVSEDIIKLDLLGDVKRVFTDDAEYECKAIILAMGATRRKLGCPGEERLSGRGVSYCATCDGNFFRGKDVCVIGGGDTALEDADYLANICNNVYLIHRRDTYRGDRILQERVIEKQNIIKMYNSVAEEIYGDNIVTGIRVKNLLTNEISDIGLSGCFVAVGNIPSSELVVEYNIIDDYKYIIADESCKTSIKGVFVAGDIRKKPLYQIVTAVSDGAVAAKEAGSYIE